MFGAVWAVIKSLGLTKYAGKVVIAGGKWAMTQWAFIVRYWHFIVIAGLVLALFGVSTLKNHTIRGLQTRAMHSEGLLAAQQPTIERNKNALRNCQLINAANTQAYLEMQDRARQAETRVTELSSRSTTQIEVIEDEAHDLRGRDEDCRRLDDPLPDWFDEWLRD